MIRYSDIVPKSKLLMVSLYPICPAFTLDIIQHSYKCSNFRFEATVGSCDTDLKPILEKVLELYLASNVERNLTQLMTMELIKPQQVRFGYKIQ